MESKVPHSGLSKRLRVSNFALAAALGLGLCSGSLLLAGAAYAQNADASDAAVKKTPAKKSTAEKKAKADASQDDSTEVIVTGVMAKTKAKKANVSYSTLNQEDLDRFVPISASDYLRDMPGTVVETNDGVGRNEVFTRGMVIGTGSNTSGYYWATILEDGLPVTPAKFGGFQDGDFYRADITTGKVESVRGGSSATGLTTSVGATFNFLDGKVRPGASIQTRIGFEGTDSHLSWKQVDGYYGWLNKSGDFGFKLTGFFRKSNGANNPGYDINHGGQFKATIYKSYDNDWGVGSFNVTAKHLDDTNGVLTSTYSPAYNYQDPQAANGWPLYPDLFLKGGVHQVPLFTSPGYQTEDPSQGFHYKQDALWLRWEHQTPGHWNFTGAAKAQYSQTFGQQYLDNGIQSINSGNAARSVLLGSAVNGLDKQTGYYMYYDDAGNLVAKVANQYNGSHIGIDYRTGAACSNNCVVYNSLPNRNFDLNGGTVTSTVPDANGLYYTGTIPSTGSNFDMVDLTKSEFTYRSSRDLMANLTANWVGDHWTFNYGIYIDRSIESYKSWGSGYGISAWGDGQVRNLNVQFLTTTGTVYQLTDSGGWGQLGAGAFGTFFATNTQTEISPYFGVAWSPDKHWDLNFSAKFTQLRAQTTYDNWNTRNPGATSLTYGGLDGNPLTVYDNLYFVSNTAQYDTNDRSAGVWNWSGSAGYNFTPRMKLYYRYSSQAQGVSGAIQRYTTPSKNFVPLGPGAFVKEHELGFIFSRGRMNGQVTYYYKDYGFENYYTATDVDNTSQYLLPITQDIYFSRGVEAWVKTPIWKGLWWSGTVTFGNGKAEQVNKWLNTGANGLGPADDQLVVNTSPIARNPRWILSNTLEYKTGDWYFNLRHRWMDKRKLANDPLDHRFLNSQNNMDFSMQYTGIKDTRISFDIRNLTNTIYVSSFDTLIGGTWPKNVQKYDIYDQLPDSALWIRHNDPRSFWLTVKHDF